RAMPSGIETLTGADITKENQDAFQQRISGFGRFLSFFAWIAVLVGGFVIYNTFSILLAQRTREMALLRAIGATRRQVLGSMLVEALAVGLVASILGLLGGIAFAAGLRAVFSARGFGFPNGP